MQFHQQRDGCHGEAHIHSKKDWANFVKLKASEEAKAASEKYKKLQERNLHDHCLGTGGYEGKAAKWE